MLDELKTSHKNPVNLNSNEGARLNQSPDLSLRSDKRPSIAYTPLTDAQRAASAALARYISKRDSQLTPKKD